MKFSFKRKTLAKVFLGGLMVNGWAPSFPGWEIFTLGTSSGRAMPLNHSPYFWNEFRNAATQNCRWNFAAHKVNQIWFESTHENKAIFRVTNIHSNHSVGPTVLSKKAQINCLIYESTNTSLSRLQYWTTCLTKLVVTVWLPPADLDRICSTATGAKKDAAGLDSLIL